MEELKEKTVDLASHVEELANTFYQLTVVNLIQKASNIVSDVVALVLVCVFGFFVLLFAGCALACWLGDIINNTIGGFLLTTAFFLILVLVIGLLRKKMIFPIVGNHIIRKVYE